MELRAEVYRSDIVLHRQVGWQPPPVYVPRGDVIEFSRKSRQRLRFVAANTDARFTTMITLTYPADYPADGQVVKGHLHRFLGWLLHNYPGQYLWFIEFQKRGAPHFHVLYRGSIGVTLSLRKVSRTWYEIVGSGDRRHLNAGTRVERLRSVEGAAHYAVKYAQKMAQKRVPDGYKHVGRFWACSRAVMPIARATCIFEGPEALYDALTGWRYCYVLERDYVNVLYDAARFLDPMLTALLPFAMQVVISLPVPDG